jgi:hypothetical protein
LSSISLLNLLKKQELNSKTHNIKALQNHLQNSHKKETEERKNDKAQEKVKPNIIQHVLNRKNTCS